jgi:short-subunit dehydrogenase
MNTDLDGAATAKTSKNVVITGAASGIGAALALRYARDGARLGLLDIDRERLEAVAEQCRTFGAPEVFAGTIDVTDREKMAASLLEYDEMAPIDLLIANAGVLSGIEPGAIAEEPEVSRRLFDVNVEGVLNTVHPLVPQMVRRHSGAIVIVSSLAAYVRMPNMPSYSASKSVVLRYATRLRRTLVRSGVQVSVVCPGHVETPMADQILGRKRFMVSPERAAERIHVGIVRNDAVIAFPRPTLAVMRFARMVPPPMRGWLLARMAHPVVPRA